MPPQILKKPRNTGGAVLDITGGAFVDPRTTGTGILPDPCPSHSKETRIGHEVKQIIKPTTTIGRRPTVQFGLHPQYLLARHQRQLQYGTDIHRRIFCHYTFPSLLSYCRPSHVTGFPDLEVLRRLRPTRVLSVGIDTYPPHPWPGCGSGGTRMVPVFTRFRSVR